MKVEEKIQNEKYVYLLNSMTNFAGITDKEGRLEFANKAPIKFFGYTEEDVIGKYFWETPWFDRSAEMKEKVKRAIEDAKKGKRVEMEISVFDKKGASFPVILNASPLKDDDKNIIGVVVEGKLIVEQKKLEKELKETVKKLKASQEELSTPVMQVWKKILVLPIIGVVDSYRAQKIMETLLNKIIETRSEIVIIDVTGVASIDTEVANHIIKAVQAAKLLGAECIITGIRPEIAQTMIHLGVDLKEFITKRDMQEGLRFGLEQIGYEIRRKDTDTTN
ncbi:MAG: PAS domain S-box protein [Candidatus Methanospirareceae archaeon]